jgi:hypothetical protein
VPEIRRPDICASVTDIDPASANDAGIFHCLSIFSRLLQFRLIDVISFAYLRRPLTLLESETEAKKYPDMIRVFSN